MIVDLEDERNLTHEFGDARLEHSERRRERVAARVDSELKMVARIVRRRIHRKAARRSMLEALVHRQDHEFARARQLAMVQHPRQVVPHAAVFRIVIAKNLSNSLRHIPLSPVGSVTAVCIPISLKQLALKLSIPY